MIDIKEIEKLVNEIADCYDHPSQEYVDKLNQLLGLDWDAETYWEYTCEYWSHDSLEATVWALLHDGEYPQNEEYRYFFWSIDSDLSEAQEETALFFRLGRYMDDRAKFNRFNSLPMADIYAWFKQEFSDWEIVSERKHEDGSISFSMEKIVEYGITRDILLFPYEDKCLSIHITNMEKEQIEKIMEYMKTVSTARYLSVD